MATDGPTPTECDAELYRDGVTACMVETKGACAFEALIVKIRQETGLPVDWHYAAGRAIVLTTPENLARIGELVRAACNAAGLRHT